MSARVMLFGLTAVALLGCSRSSLSKSQRPSSMPFPKTAGEQYSGYGYIPLDGLAVVEITDTATCFGKQDGKEVEWARRPLLEALPDITVRFAVGELTGRGGLTFGPVKITAEGGDYRAVLDYVNVDAAPVEFQIRKRVRSVPRAGDAPTKSDSVTRTLGLLTLVDSSLLEVVGYEAIAHSRRMKDDERKRAVEAGYDIVTIPTYIGVGMRLSAEIKALRGGLALTSLGSIATEAQAGSLSGTLTVQTIGITGKAVATILPLPSKLDQTTVENAILALGSSRAAVYSDTGTDVTRTARVVGLYSPFGSDPRLISAIYSALSQEPPLLRRGCRSPES